VLSVYLRWGVLGVMRPPTRRVSAITLRWRAAAGLATAICFLGVLSSYLMNSKRVYGRYFHNVNSSFYAWYDDWASASVGTYAHGDHVGWPTLPKALISGPGKYWREHSVGEITRRIARGLQDMVVRSFHTFWYFKFVALYIALAFALIAASPRRFTDLARRHVELVLFLALYAVVYLLATAFYHPISGTGTTRFLLAHVAPLLFAIAYFASRTWFRNASWTLGGISIVPGHVQMLTAVTIGLDVIFTLWPRLMTTYGGF
jgi:hypothetical protein